MDEPGIFDSIFFSKVAKNTSKQAVMLARQNTMMDHFNEQSKSEKRVAQHMPEKI